MSSISSKQQFLLQTMQSLQNQYARVMDNHKLFTYSMSVIAVASLIMLFLFFLQPTNAVVDKSSQYFYLTVFGWFGVISGLYMGLYLVRPLAEAKNYSVTGKIFHYIGVWGTRSCVLFVIFLLFATGGYLLPKHQLHWGATEKFEEEVSWIGYQLAGSSIRTKGPRFVWFSNEYLVVERKQKKFGLPEKIVLLIDNVIGSNKFDYNAIEGYLTPDLDSTKFSGGVVPKRVKLLGRKNASGIIYDSIVVIER